jgi:hypothetical protein
MNAYTRNYVLSGLAASPAILHELLQDLTPAQADSRPDPERFTIREAIAHMADWEPIWLGRVEKILAEDSPEIENLDEGEFAIRNRYHETEVAEQAARFAEGRAALVAALRPLTSEQWLRVGIREWGPLSLDGFAAMILGHDGYHLQQVIDQKKSV